MRHPGPWRGGSRCKLAGFLPFYFRFPFAIPALLLAATLAGTVPALGAGVETNRSRLWFERDARFYRKTGTYMTLDKFEVKYHLRMWEDAMQVAHLAESLGMKSFDGRNPEHLSAVDTAYRRLASEFTAASACYCAPDAFELMIKDSQGAKDFVESYNHLMGQLGG